MRRFRVFFRIQIIPTKEIHENTIQMFKNEKENSCHENVLSATFLSMTSIFSFLLPPERLEI